MKQVYVTQVLSPTLGKQQRYRRFNWRIFFRLKTDDGNLSTERHVETFNSKNEALAFLQKAFAGKMFL